jgi:hypothetical protein
MDPPSVPEVCRDVAIFSALSFSPDLVFIECDPHDIQTLIEVLIKQNIKIYPDIQSIDLEKLFDKLSIWKFPVCYMGSNFGLLNLPGFCRSPCVILHVTPDGEAIVAAIANRIESSKPAGRKHLKQLAFLDNPEYQFNREDILKVIKFEF